MSTISGSRAALSISVTPLASTAAISRFSVAPTLGKSSQIVRAAQPVRGGRDDEAVLAGDLGAHPRAGRRRACPARASRSRRRPGAPPARGRGGPAAARARRSTRAAGAPGRSRPRCRGSAGTSITRSPESSSSNASTALARRSPAAQHLRHDRDVGDPRHVGEHARPSAQQRRRHQLERGVLRADHPHLAGQPRPALDPDHIHGVAGMAAIVGSAPTVPRLYAMAVHLTRIYTKTGDAGTTALGNGPGSPRPTRASRRTPTSTSATPRSASALALGDLPDELSDGADESYRTTCSTWAPTCATRSLTDPKYPPLRVTEEYVDPPRGLVRRVQRPAVQAGLLHPAGRHPRARRCCTWPARCAGAPNARPGPCIEADPDRTNPLAGKVPQPALGPAVHPRPGGQPGRRREVGPRRRRPVTGGLHHVELWVPSLSRAEQSWGWLLGALGWAEHQGWPAGVSWLLGGTYLVIEQSPALSADTHDRLRPGPEPPRPARGYAGRRGPARAGRSRVRLDAAVPRPPPARRRARHLRGLPGRPRRLRGRTRRHHLTRTVSGPRRLDGGAPGAQRPERRRKATHPGARDPRRAKASAQRLQWRRAPGGADSTQDWKPV